MVLYNTLKSKEITTYYALMALFGGSMRCMMLLYTSVMKIHPTTKK